MTRKPTPIVLLALFQWLSPLGNLAISAWASHLTLFEYLRAAQHHQGSLNFILGFFVPPILSGFAVYWVKPWSYPVFLLCTLYGSYRSGLFSGSSVLASLPNGWSGVLWISACAANIILGAIFLLPVMRRPYFDRKQRWWEAQPRYQISLPVKLYRSTGSAQADGHIRLVNLSRGGALLEVPRAMRFQPGDELALDMTLSWGSSGTSIENPKDPAPSVFTEARVVYAKPFASDSSSIGALHVGVQFTGMSRDSCKSLTRALQGFEKLGVPRLQEKATFFEDCLWVWESLRRRITHVFKRETSHSLIHQEISQPEDHNNRNADTSELAKAA